MMSPRKILFPLSWIYGIVTSLRNLFYDKGWWESSVYAMPVICVGNLSVGGTGKSPMIEFLVEHLQTDYEIAVLSRGYGRKTKGYLDVKPNHLASEVGDEPLQIKQKFPNILVAVCEDRRTGIEKLTGKAQVILLDDAFQHRKVKPSFSIMLTPYGDLYIDDQILPAGNLRESKRGVRRADIVMVSKCPEKMPYAELQKIQFRLNLKENKFLFFSRIGYDPNIQGVSESLPLEYLKDKSFTLVTGIANPKPLLSYLKGYGFDFNHKKFPDHHDFSDAEIANLKEDDLIVTTEKDFVRLQPRLQKLALYYLPIKTIVLNDQEDYLLRLVRNSVEDFRSKN